MVCPAKHLTYCSQRQTHHAGGKGFLLVWRNTSVCNFTVLNIPTIHFDSAGEKKVIYIYLYKATLLFCSLLWYGYRLKSHLGYKAFYECHSPKKSTCPSAFLHQGPTFPVKKQSNVTTFICSTQTELSVSSLP